MIARWGLRIVALGYLAMLLLVPVGMILYHTFKDGFAPFWDAITQPDALHALRLTIEIALIVVPLNTIFGIIIAIMLVRHRVPGATLISAVLALPFVAREVMPVLREVGEEQEQAAATLGAGAFTTFRRITLPAIRWGVVYGVILATARCIGEYGAVAVVSGNVIGSSETATVYVNRSYESFDKQGAYSVAVVLALVALATVLLMTLFKPRSEA